IKSELLTRKLVPLRSLTFTGLKCISRYKQAVLPRDLCPMQLSRRPKPFDSVDYLFELKIDGFRSLACVETGPCDLVSWNRNTFHNFKALAEWIGEKAAMSCSIRSLTESLKFDHSTRDERRQYWF